MPVSDYKKGSKICENKVSAYYEATKGDVKYTLQHVTGLAAEHIQRCRKSAKMLRRSGSERVNFICLDSDGFDGTPYLVWNTSEVMSAGECLQDGRMELDMALVMLKNLVSILVCAHQNSIYHGGLCLENVFLRSGGKKVKVSEFSLIPVKGSPETVDCPDAALIAFAMAAGKPFTLDDKEIAEREARAMLGKLPFQPDDFLCMIRKALDNGFSSASDMLQELENCQIKYRFVQPDDPPKPEPPKSEPPKSEPQQSETSGAKEIEIDPRELMAYKHFRLYPNYNLLEHLVCENAKLPYVDYEKYQKKRAEIHERQSVIIEQYERETRKKEKRELKLQADLLSKELVNLENAERFKRFVPSDMIETVFKDCCYPPINYEDRESSEYHRLFDVQSHGLYNYDGKVLGAGSFATVVYRGDDDVPYVQKIMKPNPVGRIPWRIICEGAQSELEFYRLIERKRLDVSVHFYPHSSTLNSTIKKALEHGDEMESLKQIVFEMECGLSFIPFMFWFTQRSNFQKHCLVVVRDLFALLRDLHEKAGLVHGDIKPENIVLIPCGDSCKPVFIDFNSAGKIDPKTGLAFYGKSVTGTEPYDSPEVKRLKASFEGPTPPIVSVSPKSDVYSMALVVYEMLNNCCRPTGEEKDKYHEMEPPVRLSTMSDCRKAGMTLWQCSNMKKNLLRCLSFRPEKRPSAREMVQELDKIIR